MAINIRKVGEVADGSVTEVKLADNAVTNGKISDGSIIETKLADLAVSTDKLKANAVTLAKADNDMRMSPFIGDETEVSVEGTVETAVKEFNFAKKAGAWDPMAIRILISQKTNDIAYTAYAKVYIDDVEVAEMTSVSTAYELSSAEVDISALAQGRHMFSLRLFSDDDAGISYNDYVDVLHIK